MTNCERFHAVMNYKPYDHLPVVHFGFWYETLMKWAEEGHISSEAASHISDGNAYDSEIADLLGFDFNYFTVYSYGNSLFPAFEPKFIRRRDDGFDEYLNSSGATELVCEGANSIRSEVDHLLKSRESFDREYLPRLVFGEHRMNYPLIEQYKAQNETRKNPLGLHCGSLLGDFRNWIGFENLAYLYVDDEGLYDYIVGVIGELTYQYTKAMLSTGIKFDFIHFWEDICFKNGPMINPAVFREKFGPVYKRITDLACQYGITLASVDCDGCIDSLVDVWADSGINIMFPIEYGTWEGSIDTFRKKCGTRIRGVGGMNKNVFSADYSAIDNEIERLRPLIEAGGYIPCPDHRIPPDAKWENVQYYCECMHKLF